MAKKVKNKSQDIIVERNDFKHFIGDVHWFYTFLYRKELYQLSFEPCLDGFDVALYRKDLKRHASELVTERICVKAAGYEKDLLKEKPRTEPVWDSALSIGNSLIKHYILEQ